MWYLKKIIKLILIITAGLITSVLITEFTFRILYPSEAERKVERAYNFQCFTVGKYYWISMLTDRTCTLSSNAGAFRNVDIRLNKLGLRGDEVVIPKPKDVYRILFIGDSFTFGWGVEENETFSKVAGNVLNDKNPAKKIEIVNAGMPASGPGYSYLYLKKEGLNLQPDLVVMELYPYTDIVYDLHQNTMTDANHDGLPEKLSSSATYINGDGEITPKYFPVYSKLPILNQFSLLRYLLREYDKITIADLMRRENNLLTPLCLYKAGCHELDKEKETARKLFREAKAMTEKTGAKFLAVVIPAEFSLYETDVKKYPFAGALLPEERGYASKLFDAFLHTDGIDHLILYDVFKNYGNEQTYFKNDDHWNARGHQIAGEDVAGKIIEMMGE